MADSKKGEGGGGGSFNDDFSVFLGIIIIIGFIIMFWDAFKAGKITEKKTSSTPAQTTSQNQNTTGQSTTNSNGPINSVQYIPSQ